MREVRRASRIASHTKRGAINAPPTTSVITGSSAYKVRATAATTAECSHTPRHRESLNVVPPTDIRTIYNFLIRQGLSIIWTPLGIPIWTSDHKFPGFLVFA